MTQSRHNSALHLLALLTTAATFPLIFLGGLVTSHHAGMSVPDWPNSYGYNMFLFPPRLWLGGILYEHTHRLWAATVGLLAVALCLWAWRTESRKWVRWLAMGVLMAVIFQGVLGGLRVILVKLSLAPIHACFAQAFFCLTALMAIVTGRWWANAPDLSQSPEAGAGRKLVRLATFACCVIYLQLVLGAVMRHYDAGLAIPDFPTAFGKILPPTTLDDSFRGMAAHQWGSEYLRVTLFQIWIHFAHRVGAAIVSVAIIALIVRIYRNHWNQPRLLGVASLLALLLGVQMMLGILTVLLRKPADVASAHVAVGALVLCGTFVILVSSLRLYGVAWTSSPGPKDADRAVSLDSVAARHGLEARAT